MLCRRNLLCKLWVRGGRTGSFFQPFASGAPCPACQVDRHEPHTVGLHHAAALTAMDIVGARSSADRLKVPIGDIPFILRPLPVFALL